MLLSPDMAQTAMQDFELAADSELEAEAASGNKKKGGSGRLILWLLVFSIGMAVVPMLLTGDVIREERLALEARSGTLEAELNATPTINPEIATLESQLLAFRNDTSALESLQTVLQASHVDWALLMQTYIAFDATRMELTAISITDRRITLTGLANDEADLLGYVDSLQASALFARVFIQSINRNPPEVDRDGNVISAVRLVEFVIQTDLNPSVPAGTGEEATP